MPNLYPFRALRPEKRFAAKVSAKSTDFKTKEGLVREIQTNPISFHQVTKGHLRHQGSYQSPEKFLPFASQYIKTMKDDGILVKEEEDSFYFYEQVSPEGNKYSGIIGLYAVEDYTNNIIKKHEEIRTNRLQYLVELFKTARVLGEPTLLAYPGNISFENYAMEQVFSFDTPDGRKHTVSKISSPEDIAHLSETFRSMNYFYIADGHHRSASAEQFSQVKGVFLNDKTMCFVVSEDQLQILPFQRLIKPISPLSKDAILAKLAMYFDITMSDISLYSINEKGVFGVYLENTWYRLVYKLDDIALDVECIENCIIKGVFGILDSRTDSQIAFHPFTQGEAAMCSLIDRGIYQIAITNRACDFESVRQISDQGRTLPPKSTYIEPKLRSGMIIQEF